MQIQAMRSKRLPTHRARFLPGAVAMAIVGTLVCGPVGADVSATISAQSDRGFLADARESELVTVYESVGLRTLTLRARALDPVVPRRANLCENRRRAGYPRPTASSSEVAYGDCVWAGVDGIPWAGEYEWCNDYRQGGTPWYRVEFAHPSVVGEVRLFTRHGYALRDFIVVLETAGGDAVVAEVRGNTVPEWRAELEPMEATAIRVECLNGPVHQPSIRRIQELQAFAPRSARPDPPRSFAYRVEMPEGNAVFLEVREVYTHADTLGDFEYEVRIDGRTVHVRRHRCNGGGPVSYAFRVPAMTPGEHAVEFVDTSGAGLAINRMRVVSDPVGTAREQGLIRPFLIAPRLELPPPFEDPAVDQELAGWIAVVSAGEPYVEPGLLAVVGYASRDRAAVREQILAYARLAARHGIPWVLQLTTTWADTPLHVPDGMGGRFGDVRYQQIGWSEHDTYDDPGLREYLESVSAGGYDPRYGLTVPNIWSSTPWLTMNDNRLNAYKLERLREAAAVVNEVQAGPSGDLLRAIVTDDEPMYWPRITDWLDGGYPSVNGGVRRSDLVLDVNPCVVEDAARDGVLLDPKDGLSQAERLWLHENNARYVALVCRLLAGSLERRPPGSQQADLRERIFNYILAQPCYPLDDYGEPGWHLGVVPGAAIGLEAFDERYFERARDLGPLANSDFECSHPSAEVTLSWEGRFRAWYDVGCQFIQLCNPGPPAHWEGLFEAVGGWSEEPRFLSRAVSALIQEEAIREWRVAHYRDHFEPPL